MGSALQTHRKRDCEFGALALQWAVKLLVRTTKRAIGAIMGLQKALRTLQNHMPGGRDRRETLARWCRRLSRRPHEADFNALRYLAPNGLLLDVGSNYGQSIASMRLLQPEATIVGFEPNAELAAKLMDVFRADRRVTINPFGLSSEAGTLDLFVPYYRGFPYPGLASLDQEEARSWLSSDNLYLFRPDKLEVKRVQCQLQTLDSQAVEPLFIKIDVQGAELAVLRGGLATLRKHQPILLIESPGRDPGIAALLFSLGYREFEFIDGRFIQRSSQGANGFFMTGRRQAELGARNPGLFPEQTSAAA